jgi:hypothetical protein
VPISDSFDIAQAGTGRTMDKRRMRVGLPPADHPDGELVPAEGLDDVLRHWMRGDAGQLLPTGSLMVPRRLTASAETVYGAALCAARCSRPYSSPLGYVGQTTPPDVRLITPACQECRRLRENADNKAEG